MTRFKQRFTLSSNVFYTLTKIIIIGGTGVAVLFALSRGTNG